MKKKPLKVNINLYNKSNRASADSELLRQSLDQHAFIYPDKSLQPKKKLNDFSSQQKKRFTESITKAYQMFHEQNIVSQKFMSFRNSQKSKSTYSLKSKKENKNNINNKNIKKQNSFEFRLSYNGGFKFPKKSIKKYGYSFHSLQNESHIQQINKSKQKLFRVQGIRIQNNRQNNKENKQHKIQRKSNTTHIINKQNTKLTKSAVKNNNENKMIQIKQDLTDEEVQNQNKLLNIRSFYSNIIDDYCRRKMFEAESQNQFNNVNNVQKRESPDDSRRKYFDIYSKQVSMLKNKKSKGFQYRKPSKLKNEKLMYNQSKQFFLTFHCR